MPAGSLSSSDGSKEVSLDKCLTKLMQYGTVPLSAVPAVLEALRSGEAAAKEQGKEDRMVTRVLYYLVQLCMGDGCAGTPVPLPLDKGGWLCVWEQVCTAVGAAIDRWQQSVSLVLSPPMGCVH